MGRDWRVEVHLGLAVLVVTAWADCCGGYESGEKESVNIGIGIGIGPIYVLSSFVYVY